MEDAWDRSTNTEGEVHAVCHIVLALIDKLADVQPKLKNAKRRREHRHSDVKDLRGLGFAGPLVLEEVDKPEEDPDDGSYCPRAPTPARGGLALTSKAEQLASSPAAVQAMWTLHAAAYGLDLLPSRSRSSDSARPQRRSVSSPAGSRWPRCRELFVCSLQLSSRSLSPMVVLG